MMCSSAIWGSMFIDEIVVRGFVFL
jgi:hypothetical protein